MEWVTVAVYAGLLLVLIGPAVGTYCAFRIAKTPIERRYVSGVAIFVWAILISCGVLPVLLAYHGVVTWTIVAFGATFIFMFLVVPFAALTSAYRQWNRWQEKHPKLGRNGAA